MNERGEKIRVTDYYQSSIPMASYFFCLNLKLEKDFEDGSYGSVISNCILERQERWNGVKSMTRIYVCICHSGRALH
jgi:hypothetical protein